MAIFRQCCVLALCLTSTASSSSVGRGYKKGVSSKFRSSSPDQLDLPASLAPFQERERVYVCNAFVDDKPIMVTAEKGSSATALAYTHCEHYDMNFEEGGARLMLQSAQAPEDAIDALSFEDAPTVEGCGGTNTTCVAIIHRRGTRSPKGVVQWLRVPQNLKSSELATVDAYAFAGDDVARGLDAAGIPGIQAAVFRLEDKLNPELELSRQVVASRTLSLGRVYSAQPGPYHLILEDLKGSTMVGYEDISLAKGERYIMMRVGEPGSKEYPEKLVFRPLEEEEHHKKKSSTRRGQLLTSGTVLTLLAFFTLSS